MPFEDHGNFITRGWRFGAPSAKVPGQTRGAPQGGIVGARKKRARLDISVFFRLRWRRSQFDTGGHMSIGQSMLPEFDQEMQNTRKVLERVPDEKWGWKPHEKSGTVGWIAGHIATMPGWIGMTLQTQEFDYAPVDGSAYEPPKIENRQQL